MSSCAISSAVRAEDWSVKLLEAQATQALVERLWDVAANSSGNESYFLSPGWMSTWRASLPRIAGLQLACFYAGDRLDAAAFVRRKLLRRHGFVSSRAVFLNETGEPTFDQLCIKHNGVLCRAGVEI